MTKARTGIPSHIFGAAKAGAKQQEKTGNSRPMPKLPTSLDEFRRYEDKILGPSTVPLDEDVLPPFLPVR